MTARDMVLSPEQMQAIERKLSCLSGVVESAEAIDDHSLRFTLREARQHQHRAPTTRSTGRRARGGR